MTPFAHVAAGYLTTQVVDLINPSLNFNTPGIIITGIIAGNFPDLDFIFAKNKAHHRNTWTHAPLFWLVIILALFGLTKFINNGWFNSYVLAFSIGIASHFFTDWFAAREEDYGGIRLLFPFSKKHYGLMKLEEPRYKDMDNFHLGEYLKYYMENAFLFYSEVLLIILGLVVFLSRSLSVFLGIFL
jgi:hypothetical protein